MARTPEGPIVKEVKPGALIGYADVAYQTVREHGQTVSRYKARSEPLEAKLQLRMDAGLFDGAAMILDTRGVLQGDNVERL